MSTIRILVSPTIRFMPDESALPSINDDFVAGLYSKRSATIDVGDLEGEDAAEEAFDLTNNPYRQDERVVKYGRGQSLSSGDIVEVTGPVNGTEYWVCLSFGWSKL